MNILVTGAKGFVGKNLIASLNNMEGIKVLPYDLDTPQELLSAYCRNCDFVYHLAGVNRPEDVSQYMEGNLGFTSYLLELLKRHKNKSPVMLSSSIQATLDNPYGRSKLAGEQLLFNYGNDIGTDIYIYRFPNLFGKWCRPNYNSVVATFCYNIANGYPITINDPNAKLNLIYIDDVINELISLLNHEGHSDKDGYYYVPKAAVLTLSELANAIEHFKEIRTSLEIPDTTEDSLYKKLYSTYLSYLPEEQLAYPLKVNADERGSFTEILRTPERGQFSVNISKPGIEKGNHWHHTKTEKFLVVSGKALIQLRRIHSDKVVSYHVSGDKLEVVDIPVGYTHNIINEGDTDLVTFMWCNECFNPDKPDTYYLKVNEESL